MSIIILTIVWMFLIVLAFKNFKTVKDHHIIIDAIYTYHMDVFYTKNAKNLVEYEDVEDYWKTLFRLWDWGYTRILPKDKFEIIKPYIDRKEQNNHD